MTRLKNTMGKTLCMNFGESAAYCDSFIAYRRGPDGRFRPFSYDIEHDTDGWLGYTARWDELEADPRFGRDGDEVAEIARLAMLCRSTTPPW